MTAANPKVVCRRLSNLTNDKAMERTASSMSRPLNRRSGGAGECDGDGDAEIGVCVCATAACNGSAEICRQRGDVMIHLLLTEWQAVRLFAARRQFAASCCTCSSEGSAAFSGDRFADAAITPADVLIVEIPHLDPEKGGCAGYCASVLATRKPAPRPQRA